MLTVHGSLIGAVDLYSAIIHQKRAIDCKFPEVVEGDAGSISGFILPIPS